MNLEDFKKNYLTSSTLAEHSELVKKLSLKLFSALCEFFPDVQKYSNKSDLALLEYGAYLHDIGVIFEKRQGRGHHKIGRDLILENKVSILDETDNLIVANIVRYHRKSLPDANKHKFYKMLNDEGRKKTDLFASIVRFCDALDYNHFNIVDDFKAEYDKTSNVLTIGLSVNIMLNIGFNEILNKKKEFLEKTLGAKVLVK